MTKLEQLNQDKKYFDDFVILFNNYWFSKKLDKYISYFDYEDFLAKAISRAYNAKLNNKNFTYIKIVINNSIKNSLRDYFNEKRRENIINIDIETIEDIKLKNLNIENFYKFLTKKQIKICNTIYYNENFRKVSKILHIPYSNLIDEIRKIKKKSNFFKKHYE